MSIRISRVHVSALWVETTVDGLRNRLPGHAVLLRLRDRIPYGEMFTAATEGRLAIAPTIQWDLPWPKSTGQRFWDTYLERPPHRLRPDNAWHHQVPLRWLIAWPISAAWLSGTIELEAFIYPYALALLVTMRHEGSDLTLRKFTDLALNARRNGRFELVRDNDVATLPLTALADEALRHARGVVLGDQEGLTTRVASEPFTVTTVVRGQDVNPNRRPAVGGVIHHCLEQVMRGRSLLKSELTATLDELQIPARSAPPGHLLFGRERSRVVWFPASFTHQQPIAALRCYHRNQVYTALQIEAMGGFLARVAEDLDLGLTMSAGYEECARGAAGALTRLFAGSPATYRSGSARAHIEQNGLLPILDRVRRALDMTPLATQPASTPSPG
jgi:hypothetical protein